MVSGLEEEEKDGVRVMPPKMEVVVVVLDDAPPNVVVVIVGFDGGWLALLLLLLGLEEITCCPAVRLMLAKIEVVVALGCVVVAIEG